MILSVFAFKFFICSREHRTYTLLAGKEWHLGLAAWNVAVAPRFVKITR